jgi:lipid-binding SYLF domain-containing protein
MGIALGEGDVPFIVTGPGLRRAVKVPHRVYTGPANLIRSALSHSRHHRLFTGNHRKIDMDRRQFLISSSAALAAGGLTLSGCTTTPLGGSDSASQNAAKRASIDADVDATLARLYGKVGGSRDLLSRATGVLVFPSVISAGFWVGGQYGTGALRVNGRTTGYYSTVAGSFGLQIGLQSKAIIFAFMNQQVLDKFLNSQGWSAGADATVALVNVGANGNVDTSTANNPVEAFVLTNAGLMAGVSLEGVKVSRLVI